MCFMIDIYLTACVKNQCYIKNMSFIYITEKYNIVQIYTSN